MLDSGRINTRQFKIVTMLFCLGSAIIIVPSALASAARQDGWIAGAIGAAAGLAIVPLFASLGSRFPGKSIIACCDLVLGRWIGKPAAFLFFIYFFIIATLVLRNIGDFITTIVMPETPIQAIHILFLLIVVMGARLGMEVIVRTAEIFLPWIVGLIVILVLFIAPQIHWSRMLPMFEYGIRPIVKGSISIIAIPYLELVVLMMVLPLVNEAGKAGKAWLTGAMAGGIVLIVVTMLCISVLGWDFTARHTFPSYTLAKKIHIGEFLQRIEVLMAVIWFVTIFFKLVVTFYASATALAELSGLKTYRPLLFPLAMIMIVLSLVVYPNFVYFRTFAEKSWPPYALTFGLALPLLLLLVAILRGLGKRRSDSSGTSGKPHKEPQEASPEAAYNGKPGQE